MAQTRYNKDLRVGRAGDPADSGPKDIISLINDDPRTAQVSTITVDSASNSTTYSVTLNEVVISFTSDASATTAEIATGLAAAINAEPLVAASVSAEAASAVVTVTSSYAGRAFTLTSSEADLTLATGTANDSADPVPFGAAVIFDPADAKYGRLLKTANLSARTRTITVGGTAENAKLLIVTLTINGRVYTGQAVTSGSATVSNVAISLLTTINDIAPADTVLATSSSGVVTLTAEAPGVDFDVSVVGDKLTTMTLVIGGESFVAFDSIDDAFAGIAQTGYRHETAGATGEFAGGSAMSVMRSGRVKVDTAEQVLPGRPVYVSMTDGKTFRQSAADGYIKLPRCSWKGSLSASVGVLSLNA